MPNSFGCLVVVRNIDRNSSASVVFVVLNYTTTFLFRRRAWSRFNFNNPSSLSTLSVYVLSNAENCNISFVTAEFMDRLQKYASSLSCGVSELIGNRIHSCRGNDQYLY